jgi:ribosomal protein S15
VRGVTTDFVKSFDEAGGIEENNLSLGIRPGEIEQTLSRSGFLALPTMRKPSSELARNSAEYKRQVEEQENIYKENVKGHVNAASAIRRIVELRNASAKDRHHVNVKRCVQTFGRHDTDVLFKNQELRRALYAGATASSEITQKVKSEIASIGHDPKEPSADVTAAVTESQSLAPSEAVGKASRTKARAGPDTGSSEVQIAILTAKIRALANFLETRGKMDKVNKRNLRLLVHRRQKLLAYLRRKDRGGPRWMYVTNTLGLTEGTWKGEISL